MEPLSWWKCPFGEASCYGLCGACPLAGRGACARTSCPLQSRLGLGARKSRNIKMSKQNVYDNEVFFEGYKKIRENKVNANILFEKPALFSLLPDLKDLKILDLGCGYGENSKEFVKRGAAKVTGIDISKKNAQNCPAGKFCPKR